MSNLPVHFTLLSLLSMAAAENHLQPQRATLFFAQVKMGEDHSCDFRRAGQQKSYTLPLSTTYFPSMRRGRFAVISRKGLSRSFPWFPLSWGNDEAEHLSVQSNTIQSHFNVTLTVRKASIYNIRQSEKQFWRIFQWHSFLLSSPPSVCSQGKQTFIRPLPC